MLNTYSSALAPGTYINRAKQAESFITFAVLYVNYFAPSVTDICMYSQYLANKHPSISTVKNYLSGAKSWVAEHNGNIDSFLSNEVPTLCKGIAKNSDHVVSRALPLTIAMLSQVCKFLDCYMLAIPAIKPCLLIGFSCYLRGGNLVYSGNDPWLDSHVLKANDVVIEERGLSIRIPSTKTLRFPYYLHIPYNLNALLCPVRAWITYKSKVNPRPHGPAFVVAKGTSLSQKVVLAAINSALSNDP